MGISRWQKEFEDALQYKSTVILCGNLRDRYLYQSPHTKEVIELLTLREYLIRHLGRNVQSLRFYDPVSKIRVTQVFATGSGSDVGGPTDWDSPTSGSASLNEGQRELSGTDSAAERRPDESTVDRDLQQIRRELLSESNLCYVIQYSDKITTSTAQSETEMRLVLQLEKIIENLGETNVVVITYLFPDQVPRELYQNNPKARMIEIPDPDREDLMTLFRSYYGLEVAEAERARNVTDGLKLLEVEQIVTNLEDGFQIDRFEERVRLYKFGETKNYWDEISLTKLDRAEETFSDEVKGQKEAIDKVITVLIRARADIQRKTGGNPRSPRGKLYFAGPTGVGKTLMAKTIAHFLFGSREMVLRFDMSEYSQEFQVARLYGAPPGYVGYESGGTLTNAVKEKPFSVILFDEIEKAHSRVFDIFLQILEDGRLTDSKGDTVFFSESLIIFTSNLGTRSSDLSGNRIDERQRLEGVRATNDMEKIRNHFLESVESFFQFEISRPELLNRIGRDNIVVFNYITTEDTVRSMFDHYLQEVQEEFNKSYKSATPELSVFIDTGRVRDFLFETFFEEIKEFGGRQVENIINTTIRDNLARYVLEAEFEKMNEGQIRVMIEDGGLAFELR